MRIGFLLLPGFGLMSYAGAVEPLRGANQLSGRSLYEWTHIALDASATASSGATLLSTARVGDEIDVDAFFVCAAANSIHFSDRLTMRWLARLAGKRILLGGVSGGAFVLARSGLLDGYRCTLHWEHIPAFREEFPHIPVEQSLFVLDRERLTCAGGAASLDMMHALIQLQHGPELATAVSDWYVHTNIRSAEGNQRISLGERYGTSNARLIGAIQEIERRIVSPPNSAELAGLVGTDVRHLERLFRRELGTTAGALSRRVRLTRAQTLLRQTSLPVIEIAIMCGFANASHFARAYKDRHGHTPRAERRRSHDISR